MDDKITIEELENKLTSVLNQLAREDARKRAINLFKRTYTRDNEDQIRIDRTNPDNTRTQEEAEEMIQAVADHLV